MFALNGGFITKRRASGADSKSSVAGCLPEVCPTPHEGLCSELNESSGKWSETRCASKVSANFRTQINVLARKSFRPATHHRDSEDSTRRSRRKHSRRVGASWPDELRRYAPTRSAPRRASHTWASPSRRTPIQSEATTGKVCCMSVSYPKPIHLLTQLPRQQCSVTWPKATRLCARMPWTVVQCHLAKGYSSLRARMAWTVVQCHLTKGYSSLRARMAWNASEWKAPGPAPKIFPRLPCGSRRHSFGAAAPPASPP